MSEHKIQSTDAAEFMKKSAVAASALRPEDEETFDNFDSSPAKPRSKQLVINLDPVPKFLQNLVEGWAPEGEFSSQLSPFWSDSGELIYAHASPFHLLDP